jgi:hypothetical protein
VTTAKRVVTGRLKKAEVPPFSLVLLSTAEVGGAASSSTSPGTVLPDPYISISRSDGDTEIVFISTRKMKGLACQRSYDNCDDSSERQSKPERKHVKLLHGYAESGNSVSDSLLQSSEA